MCTLYWLNAKQLVVNFWRFNTCSCSHPQHLHRTGMWGAWSPDNWTFVRMWPLGVMKGAGPHSQRNWPSLTTTEQAGITYRRYPRDILQLCYKCYSGQATCSSVNKTSHPASQWDITSQNDTVSLSWLLWLDICQWSLPLSLYTHIVEAT